MFINKCQVRGTNPNPNLNLNLNLNLNPNLNLNLYLQSLLGGFIDGPEPDPEIREELESLDTPELHARLRRIDPDGAERIHPNDRRRTIRSLEVHAITGTPLSELQGQWAAAPRRSDIRIIGLHWPPEDINPRINARVKAMIEAGFVDEVRSLLDAGRLGTQAREALGYKQIAEHLEGLRSLEDAIEEIKIRTRRFAKQQRTWLRRFQHVFDGHWLEPAGKTSQALVDEVFTSGLLGPEKPA